MDITWLGHSGVRIKSGSTAIVMDPFPSSLGLRLPPAQSQAAVVTISSDDPVACDPSAITSENELVIITGPGEYEAAGLRIKGIRTPRDAGADQQRWNTAYVVEAEGMTLAHLGEPARLLTNREIEDLNNPHVLFLPVGSKSSYSPADAVEMINAISPRITIPILYAHAGNKADLRDLGPFLQEIGGTIPDHQSRLTLSRATLPEEAQLVVLDSVAVLL